MEDKAEGLWGVTTVTASGLTQRQMEANILARNQATQTITQINTGYEASLGQAAGASQKGLAPRRINILITEVENGRTVQLEGRTYVVSEGSSLIGVIGSALVELKLEN